MKKIALIIAMMMPSIAVANSSELECLAMNVYHEARGERIEGRVAVAYVTMNRVNHTYFPDSVCKVVKQRRGKKCQFSWYCDGRSDRPKNKQAWIEALDVASLVYYNEVEDPTKGALFYHTTSVRPVWRHRLDYYRTIGVHKFYHWDGNWNND